MTTATYRTVSQSQNTLLTAQLASASTIRRNTVRLQVDIPSHIIIMPTAASDRPKVLLLGDSLTQISFDGWGGGLAHRYHRRADILNRGMSGYNTRWFLRYAQDSGIWKESSNVVLVTIFFGANDASLESENPHHHVPLEEYQENLKKLVALTKENYGSATKILMITPPPVHHEQRLAFQKQRYKDKATGILERTLESAGKYAAACRDVAKELDLPCLDLYTVMMNDDDGGDFGKFLSDGLHFSKEGNAFVLKQLLATLSKEFPSLSVTPDPITGQENNSGSSCEGITSSGPYHDEIDSTCWEKIFEKKDDATTEEPEAKRAKTEEETK
jgi:lysophospholipase L1-like esterase